MRFLSRLLLAFRHSEFGKSFNIFLKTRFAWLWWLLRNMVLKFTRSVVRGKPSLLTRWRGLIRTRQTASFDNVQSSVWARAFLDQLKRRP